MTSWTTDANSPNTAERMIQQLAGVCNHASTLDGSGFSRLDSAFGHSLAQQASNNRAWSVKQATAALKLLRKYQRQLGGQDFMDNWLQSPIFCQKPIDPLERTTTDATADRKLVSSQSDALFIFRYDAQVVQSIKTDLKGEHGGKKFWASWHPDKKCWSVPVNETSIAPIMDVAERFGFDVEQRFIDYLEKIQEKTQESRTLLSLNDNRHVVVVSDKIMISVADAAILEEFENALND
jgi:hypothetical protein